MSRIMIVLAFVLLVIGGGLSACSRVTTEPNEEAVLNAKPYFFGSGGVYDTPVRGSAFIAPSTSAIKVNMQPEQHTLELNDLMTSDGVPLDFDASVVTRVTDSVALIRRFGVNWYDNNVRTELLSYIRDAVKNHGLNETAISSTAAASIDAEVSRRLEAYLKRTSFPVELTRFTLGRANPPDSVKNQRIATAQQQQRILTLRSAGMAEDQRLISEGKRAKADQAYKEGLNMTQEQYLEKLKLDTLSNVCGNKNCTFIQQGIPLIVK